MSEENVEIVRRITEAAARELERGDPGGAAAFDSETVADDFEWILPDGVQSHRGPDGIRKFMRTWTEDFEDWSFEIERLIAAPDDRVVVLSRQWGTGKGSGVPVEWHLGQVWELEDGRVTRIRNFLEPAEALEAAGLSEVETKRNPY